MNKYGELLNICYTCTRKLSVVKATSEISVSILKELNRTIILLLVHLNICLRQRYILSLVIMHKYLQLSEVLNHPDLKCGREIRLHLFNTIPFYRCHLNYKVSRCEFCSYGELESCLIRVES